jgi:hypothetical protein
MLFKIDTIHGHVVEDTPTGPIYKDDGTPVDLQNLRPCLGCNKQIGPGDHDPCISELPGTYQACCGHGLEKTPVGERPSGYAALKDGRCIRFSGLCGGQQIRAAVEAALKDEPLPAGFEFDADRMWWEGLTDNQRNYVQANMTRGLAKLVSTVTGQEPPSERIISGEAAWHEDLDENQKAVVWSKLNSLLAELVQEALAVA